jgi:RimJ/RimL family protein N-acetyltransferase
MRVRTLQFVPFARRHAEQMLSWHYPPPYDFYDPRGTVGDESIAGFLKPELHYFAVLDECGAMIAFRCFGADARVSGGDYQEDALDLGGGLRPDLTGRGLGRHVIAAAMNFAIPKFRPHAFRTTVAGFNARALKVCLGLGYRVSNEFARPSDGVGFAVLKKEAVAMALTIPAQIELPR